MVLLESTVDDKYYSKKRCTFSWPSLSLCHNTVSVGVTYVLIYNVQEGCEGYNGRGQLRCTINNIIEHRIHFAFLHTTMSRGDTSICADGSNQT